MRSHQQVFRRREVKYLLQDRQYEKLLHLLRNHIEPDDFFEGDIVSLYFDTPDFLLIRRSLERPDYKEKLRLRCYGLPEDNSRAFLEIKKKCAGIVYKRRESLPYEQAFYYLQGAEWGGESQIFREMDWMLQFYGTLQPAMLLSCHRLSYRAKDSSGVRITFDRDIIWRSDTLDPRAGIWGDSLFPGSHWLMELKLSSAMPLWLSQTLSQLHIYPRSVSKYGLAYQTLQAQTAGYREVRRHA